jgi:hypothetical protein
MKEAVGLDLEAKLGDPNQNNWVENKRNELRKGLRSKVRSMKLCP